MATPRAMCFGPLPAMLGGGPAFMRVARRAACLLAVGYTADAQMPPGAPGAGGKGGAGNAGSSGTGASGGAGGSSTTSGAAGTIMPGAGEGGTGGVDATGAGASSGPGGAGGSAIAGAGGGGTIGTAGTSGSAGGDGGGQAGGPGVAGQAGGSLGGSSGAGGGGGGAKGCDWTSPDGRIVLFDGTSLSGWQNTNTGAPAQWRLGGDGSMEVVAMNPSVNIQSTMKFDDLCLHVEYMTPMYPASVTGQQRRNSGIYFRRSYEMQVLDSYGRAPEIDGCGAVYMISPPLVVACNMQLVWNTYEIEFRASQWNASGKKTKNAAFALATLNGQVVQRNVDLNVSMTTAGQPDMPGPQPFMLQDHGNTVRYRNIWAKIPN